MSYLALARKWRPRTFEDVVGQPHVVRALANALTSGRVHHAFLFAGTRGVGKTTVARILARCLNCEQGVTATPCGQCSACVAIEQGRFVDLIEVDAASRTGVDDTRELLDNVQYTPSGGRYKVYLIDEVHMLSKPAFNALLKTLEEPPPHVKFLFATTDPQKLPVTVLSRCLQFNLKRLPVGLIVERMGKICTAEGISAEPGALQRLGRAAAGSMRDGLSLLDQALAYGNETLRESDVAEMLGSIDRGKVLALIEGLAGGEGAELLGRIRGIAEMSPDYGSLLDEMATILQRLAVIQIAGEGSLDEEDDVPTLVTLAGRIEPELTQLFYQIAITSRHDLPLAPDPQLGFEMAMLRMLAFRVEPGQESEPAAAPVQARTVPPPRRSTATARPPGASPGEDWPAFVKGLALDGAARQLAMHTSLLRRTEAELRLGVDPSDAHFLTEQQKIRVVAAIHERLGDGLRVSIDVCQGRDDTVAVRVERQEEDALQRARDAIETDPHVRELTDLLGAELVPGSIKPPEAEKQPRGKAGARRGGHESKERSR
ncbi:MAG: DNA polymerase III subunit gamma/tau [Gammaproteobacteria bacterium]|nr:DNA polymerase III subunit gamma/tau [Gammaproteobacteria bacterium]